MKIRFERNGSYTYVNIVAPGMTLSVRVNDFETAIDDLKAHVDEERQRAQMILAKMHIIESAVDHHLSALNGGYIAKTEHGARIDGYGVDEKRAIAMAVDGSGSPASDFVTYKASPALIKELQKAGGQINYTIVGDTACTINEAL